MQQGFKQYINEKATWMPDEKTKAIAREKIDTLRASIGYTSVASNDETLDAYYDKVRIIVYINLFQTKNLVFCK